MVSHSQDFLNTVCNKIVWLHDRDLKYYGGNYATFCAQVEAEEKIQLKDKEETIVTPAVYERMGGMGASKKWRKSIRLANNTDKHLGNHLAELGAVKGESVVGRRVAIYWVDDKSYYLGVVDSFTSQTGEHGIKYDDGEIEDLFLSLIHI